MQLSDNFIEPIQPVNWDLNSPGATIDMDNIDLGPGLSPYMPCCGGIPSHLKPRVLADSTILKPRVTLGFRDLGPPLFTAGLLSWALILGKGKYCIEINIFLEKYLHNFLYKNMLRISIALAFDFT
jgi:hypothetical protein